jgi:hypothetical protein
MVNTWEIRFDVTKLVISNRLRIDVINVSDDSQSYEQDNTILILFLVTDEAHVDSFGEETREHLHDAHDNGLILTNEVLIMIDEILEL